MIFWLGFVSLKPELLPVLLWCVHKNSLSNINCCIPNVLWTSSHWGCFSVDHWGQELLQKDLPALGFGMNTKVSTCLWDSWLWRDKRTSTLAVCHSPSWEQDGSPSNRKDFIRTKQVGTQIRVTEWFRWEGTGSNMRGILFPKKGWDERANLKMKSPIEEITAFSWNLY